MVARPTATATRRNSLIQTLTAQVKLATLVMTPPSVARSKTSHTGRNLIINSTISITLIMLFCICSSSLVHAATTLPFKLGEKATYDISWLGIVGGEGILQIKENSKYNGKDVYVIDVIGRSIGWVRTLYKTDDHAFSYFDISGMYSHRVEINISEGSYKRLKIIEFDQSNLKAKYMVDEDPPEVFDIDFGSQDSFSALYAFRTMRDKLKVGEMVKVPLFEDKKKYDLEVRVLRKELLKLPQGMIDTIVIQPKLKTEGVFRRKGKMTLWLADDDSLLPIRIKSKILIGSFTANLRDFEGVNLHFIPYPEPKNKKEKK